MVLLEENLSSGDALDGARRIERFDLRPRQPAEQIAIPGGRSRRSPVGLDGLVSRVANVTALRLFFL
jgi:hypothetical protein